MTANATFDFVPDRNDRRAVPYVVADGGYLRQRTLVGRGRGTPGLQPFISTEGTVSAGLGARIVSDGHSRGGILRNYGEIPTLQTTERMTLPLNIAESTS